MPKRNRKVGNLEEAGPGRGTFTSCKKIVGTGNYEKRTQGNQREGKTKLFDYLLT